MGETIQETSSGLAVEMESFALFANARYLKQRSRLSY